ncbi:MAG: DinB family protein [Flavobacteriales bacterium]|nr:DinB family protein [Flavobacteriales bacterium]
MSILTSLREFYNRDLEKLAAEIASFDNDEQLWEVRGDITNSAGNLALHLCGNIDHFIGAILGNTGYVRERDKEFSTKGLSKEALVTMISECKTRIDQTLSNLEEDILNKPYPVEVFGKPMTHGHFLIHLTTHFNYHLGQLNYLRRMMSV